MFLTHPGSLDHGLLRVRMNLINFECIELTTIHIYGEKEQLCPKSTFDEVLWIMRKMRAGRGQVTLDQRPHFYTRNPREYARNTLKVEPARDLQQCLTPGADKQQLYVVLDSGHHILLDIGSSTVIFGNVWTNMKDEGIIIMKGEY